MNDDRLRDLMNETAEAVEPGDRLDAIRAATSGGRRTAWVWWATGGAGLVAASVVTAVVLGGGASPQGTRPGPADSAVPTPTSPTPSATEPAPDVELSIVAVYYVGDTPDGPRLYREFRRVGAADPFGAAIAALSLVPVDPDYRNLWPADAIQDVSFDGIGDDAIIGITVDPASRPRPPA